MTHLHRYFCLGLLGLLCLAERAHAQEPTLSTALGSFQATSPVKRGASPLEKLDLNLRLLVQQFSRGPSGQPQDIQFDESGLLRTFGIAPGTKNPSVEVAISLKSSADIQRLQKAGANVRFRYDSTLYATVPVRDLERVAREQSVIGLSTVRAAAVPKPPAAATQATMPAARRGSTKTAEQFDRQGLTGRGVIVGIVDSGIDWRHPDFIKADGTSRILFLYDMIDDSYATSGGKVGTTPPFSMDSKPLGTLYTSQQINDALQNRGTVNSRDLHGHGTACAGTAAGNGRGTGNGVPAGTYPGVAPEADLIVGRAGDGTFTNYHYGVQWILQKAKALGKPCVVSLSMGTQESTHDGNEPEEAFLDKLVGRGIPGAVVCVAAGNDRNESFHAGGRFGANREGQADRFSSPIEVFVSKFTYMHVYFNPMDEWALGLQGKDNFLVDPSGQPVQLFVWREGQNLKGEADFNGVAFGGPIARTWTAEGSAPANAKEYLEQYVFKYSNLTTLSDIVFPLPPGAYYAWAYGSSAKVTSGRFDMYLPEVFSASFGKGVDPQYMVGSPGNARGVITVGAYDFRDSWKNLRGGQTYYNLQIGDISNYSSPGYCRDGRVKPDITAPATYTISSLARVTAGTYAMMGMRATASGSSVPDSTKITADGYHLAWNGTSAATPYVAGVVALMLQKNPTLDAQQVRDILTRYADKDTYTAGLPNRDWGYGKINPAVALKMASAR